MVVVVRGTCNIGCLFVRRVVGGVVVVDDKIQQLGICGFEIKM
jgi:hypothetical protein